MVVKDKVLGTGRTGGREATAGVIPGRFALSVGSPELELEPPRGWKWTLLSSVAQLESGHTPSRKHPEYWNGGIPWIGIKDATENHGRTINNTYQHVTELGLENSSARLLPARTVCLSRTASVGFVVVMGRPMATSQDFVNWVCGPNIDSDYLKYILVAEKEALWRFASGTTHQTIYYPEAKAFHVCLPPIDEQKAIVKILSSLDDKIELNRRMNVTLEAMARALFKAWFVDFEPVHANKENRPSTSASPEIAKLFPSDFENGIPKGWHPSNLDEVIEIKHGFAFKGEFFSEKETDKILLTPGNFKIGGGFNGSKFKYYNGDVPFDYELERNDLIVTMTDLSKGGDTLGYPALVPHIAGKKLLHNQRLGKVVFTADLPLKFFLYLAMREGLYKAFVLGSATGSTVRHTSPKRICDYKVILPNKETLIEFDEFMKSIISKEQENEFENNLLGELRDSLLPRFISGKISFAEK